MAEIVLPTTPKIVGADGLEASYKQGQQQLGTQSPAPPTQTEQEKYLNENLPFLRKKAELYKLIKEIHEGQVMMGELPSNRVPGLLGMELRVREYQAGGFLVDMVHMENRRKEEEEQQRVAMEKEKEELEKQIKDKKEELRNSIKDAITQATAPAGE